MIHLSSKTKSKTQTEKFHIMNPDPGNPVPNYALKDDIHLKVLQDRDGGNMDLFTSLPQHNPEGTSFAGI